MFVATTISFIDFPGQVCQVLYTNGCNFSCPFCHNPELKHKQNTSVEVYKDIPSVCITGGEPTIHGSKLVEECRRIKALGKLIKVDTNGTNLECITDLIEGSVVDYIAMDVKNLWSEYPETTRSMDPSVVKMTFDYLCSVNTITVEFRTTLVKPFLTVERVKTIADMIPLDKTYSVQNFRPLKVLDPSVPMDNFTSDELDEIRDYLKLKNHKYNIR